MSSSIQNKIKDTIKRSTDLEVDQVNINIKDIEGSKNSAKNNQTKIKINNVQVNKDQTKEDKSEESSVK